MKYSPELSTDSHASSVPVVPAYETQDASDAASDRYQGDWDQVAFRPIDDNGVAEAERKAFVAGTAWREQNPVRRVISQADFNTARDRFKAVYASFGKTASPTMSKLALTAALAALDIEVDRGCDG